MKCCLKFRFILHIQFCFLLAENNWDNLKHRIDYERLVDMLANLPLSGDRSKKAKGKDDKHIQTCNNAYQVGINKKGNFFWVWFYQIQNTHTKIACCDYC